MRRATALLIVLVGCGGGLRTPDPYGLPVTCTAGARECWQAGERVSAPKAGRPCIAPATWDVVQNELPGFDARTESERRLALDTFACFKGE